MSDSMRTFESVEAFAGSVGAELGPGPWVKVEQSRVDTFADATGDHQWIHVDEEKAAAGPFGGTIAHGYLTLSLLPWLMKDLYTVQGVGMGVNYGLNKVRFPAPVRVGSAVRVRARIASVDPVAGGYQVVMAVTVESDGGDKPVCVAETVSRVYPAQEQP